MNLAKLKILVLTFSFFTLHSSFLLACQCPFTKLSLDECNKYELIFRGKIISSGGCIDKQGEVVFEILELYKGNTPMSFNVIYDCGVECAQSFTAGEEWVIYTNYRQISNAKMDWCSRSRKRFRNDKEDYYAVTYGNTYEEELNFLRKNLGTHKLLKEQAGKSEERNIRPSILQSAIMVLISIGAIVLFYYLFKKFLR
jgi:hypothetical protein